MRTTEEELAVRALPAAYQEKMARYALAGWRFRRMPWGRWFASRPGQVVENGRGTLLLLLDDIAYGAEWKETQNGYIKTEC